MHELSFGKAFDRGSRLCLSILFVQERFWRDCIGKSAKVESPNISAYCLQAINLGPGSRPKQPHLKLCRELPQPCQCLDLMSQHKL